MAAAEAMARADNTLLPDETLVKWPWGANRTRVCAPCA